MSEHDVTPLPYESAFEAVEHTKQLVRLWLERHLLLYADRYAKPAADFVDMYVDRAEVDAFLAGGPGGVVRAALADLDATEARIRERIARRTLATVECGGSAPLEDVRAAFGIADERVLDVLRALLVVEVDPGLMRAFSHAWCDFTRRHVDIGFLLELLGRTADDQARLCDLFLSREHPLLRLGAIEIYEPAGHGGRVLMQRAVRLTDRIVQFLCGRREPALTMAGARVELSRTARHLNDLLIEDEVRDTFRAAFKDVVSGAGRPTFLLLHGPKGSGRRSLCEAGAAGLDRPVLTGRCPGGPVGAADAGATLTDFFREARLHNAIPMLEDVDAAFGPDESDTRWLDGLSMAAGAHRGPVVLSSRQPLPRLRAHLQGLVEVPVPHPTFDLQVAHWRQALPEDVSLGDGLSIEQVVQRYSLTGGTIREVAAALVGATVRGRRRSPLGPGEVLGLVRDHLRHRLGSLAVPLERGHGWDDLVVPDETRRALREVVSFVRNRQRIVRDWGFGAKISYGRGTAALFQGPPGTGKTMAASILANDLGMAIFQIDLSRIVDKYIGETEKNLGRVFDEGARAQAILLFDEADSLFSRRTSVGSSNDRYANLEVNFLLQRIEQYEGVTILTTNAPDSIDDAFKRRLRFKVAFPSPNADERAVLWRTLLPREAPVDAKVDLGLLARLYELSGANIKNVVLRAAALAADGEGVMDMQVFREAADREYVDMGKLVRTGFGK